MTNASTVQKDNSLALLNMQKEQNIATTTRHDQLRETLEKKMADMQTGNERKLDEMRATVDEKLQKTLEIRLGESFKLVSERLEAVHKGLGDMQQLATGVGDLKRVLTNVKSRGVLGEYQLESILEQILTIDQYGRNVKTKEGSNALVEFAIKLPGRGDKDKPVWLPIDSKFPKEDFESLMDAYDQVLPDLIEECRKSFVKGIRKCAVDISSKYVDPPNTTDFAILFLPFESLYAEVLRTPGLFESLQREHKIIITGPTTLSALLNSLQMGFRTLAIERRSGEVWQLLGAVKTEFGNFGGILEKTQKKLQEASNVIEQAGVRSRAIEKKLRAVQELPKEEAVALIGQPNPLKLDQEDEEEENEE
jgi:DNA recombination protein RmuC